MATSNQAIPHAPMTDLHAARVTGCAGPWFYLANPADTNAAPSRALCAASCLLAPVEGDLVLYSAPQPLPVMAGTSPSGHRAAYIVAVLARAEANTGRLTLPGGAAIEASNGNVRMVGGQVGLCGRNDVAIETPALQVTTVVTHLRTSRLEATATMLRGQIGSIELMASRVTSTLGRVWQTMQDSFRQVSGVDDTRAGRVRLQVAQQAHIQARHVTLLAEEHVKIDGAKVDLG